MIHRVVSASVIGGMLLAVHGVAVAAPGVTTRVSVASDGTQANGGSTGTAVSGDGRYVAFGSSATNLVPDDTNARHDVFVHDRAAGTTTRISVAPDGTQGNGLSFTPAISRDGRYVAFFSLANNLVPGDTNGTDDMFVYDRTTGTTRLVNVASDGSQSSAIDNDFPPAISADGRYIAFGSGAGNLVAGDTNGADDVFVHDQVTATTSRVSVASDGAEANRGGRAPAISDDGRYVAFHSQASNLVPGDTNGIGTANDVFVHDRATGATTRVSVASDGTEANGDSGGPAMSGDGRYVGYASAASNLVPGDTNGAYDVFVHDRATGATARVSVASDGSQAEGGHTPELSGDGRYVAFQSQASNLVPGDTNGASDVFVHDRSTGATTRVSVASDGSQGNGFVDGGYSISGDGRYVAFSSLSSNLVAGDTNGTRDVFLHDRGGTDTTPPTLTLPDPITVDATSPQGATITFAATAVDDTDPTPTLSCAPPSDGTFPIGSTTVTCTASDATGNQATGSFTVTVVGAAGQLEDLEALIVAYPLKPTVEASLLNKITGAQDALAAGKTNAACSKLADLLNQVGDFRSARKLTAAQATELTGDADRIRAVIGCGL